MGASEPPRNEPPLRRLPVAMWTLDLSALREALQTIDASGTPVEQWLMSTPSAIEHAIGLVRIVATTERADKMSGEVFLTDLGEFPHEAVRRNLVAMWNGALDVELPLIRHADEHGAAIGRVHVSLADGCQTTWRRAYVVIDLDAPRRELESLAHRVSRDDILLALPSLAEDRDEQALLQAVLARLEALTSSRISFLHAVHDDQRTIELVTWSQRTLDDHCTASFANHYPVASAGIWADAIRQRQPVIINDYSAAHPPLNVPDGHAALRRTLICPVLERGHVVLVVGLGNKSTPYGDDDLEATQLVANELWQVMPRRRDSRALAQSEARLNAAQRVAGIGSWELDLETEQIAWSAECYRITGRDPATFVPTIESVVATVHPQDAPAFRYAIATAIGRNEPLDLIHRTITQSGQVITLHEHATLLTDADGTPTGMLGTAQDVTAQLASQKRLRQNAAALRATSEGVVMTDLDGNILDANDAFTRITGYTREDALGHTPRLLKSGLHPDSFYAEMWQQLRSDGSWQGEIWNRRADVSTYPERLTINRVCDERGEPFGYVAVFSDITALKEAERRLAHMALHDSLTDLPNRAALQAALEEAVARDDRDAPLTVALLDIDRFKDVNDTLGHEAGDELLVQLAERLRAAAPGASVVARMGGDEFVVLLACPHRAVPAALKQLAAAWRAPFEIRGQLLRVTCSVGVALAPDHGPDARTLLSNADAALYRAKADGRDTHRYYSRELTDAIAEQLRIGNALHVALEQDQLALVFQPQVELATGRWVGAEALLRWRHPTLGDITPSRFVPIAELTGAMRAIGSWVLQATCRQARSWLDAGVPFGRLAFNVSASQLRDATFVDQLQAAMAEHALPPHSLAVELTESTVVKSFEITISQLSRLREVGVDVAIDDFGIGYSSLSHLKRLPVDTLKIDRSFVTAVPNARADAALVETVLSLANAFGLHVIAEGVETEEQAATLLALGCRVAQGFHYARPLTAEAFARLVTRSG